MNKVIGIMSLIIFTITFLTLSGFSQPDTLTIIHVNDSHSNLLPYASGESGGMARAASIIGQWRMTEPNPILLNAGDFMVGTLMFNTYFGVAELQLLEGLGFDALVLGNHEFDGGPVDLGNILQMAQLGYDFQIICSNALNCQAIPILPHLVHSYTIEQRGNVKIGIMGLTTPQTNFMSNPAPIIIDENLVQCAMQTIGILQAKGCQVILILSHLGLALDKQVAPYLSGVDAIIGGHSHTILENEVYVNNIPIVQAGEFYHYVGKLTLIYDGNSTTLEDYTLQVINSTIPPEPVTDATIQALKAGIIAQYTPVIGDPYQTISFTPDTLFAYPQIDHSQKVYTLDSPMGNLITTAMRNYVGTSDCALEPNGHIVEELFSGEVTAADLFRTYPYGYDATDGLGFRLASFDLSGAQILFILEQLLQFVDPLNEDWEFLPQANGLSFTAYLDSQGMQLETATIGGVPVNQATIYEIVSSDRVVGYLESMFGLVPTNLTIYPISVFQVAKEFVETIDTLNFKAQGTILLGLNRSQNIDIVDNFELKQNYPNPFNPITTIAFDLPKASVVTLKIFNILGEEVRTLHSGQLLPGSYKYEWDASNFGSGVYFYTLEALDYTQTRKLILLK